MVFHVAIEGVCAGSGKSECEGAIFKGKGLFNAQLVYDESVVAIVGNGEFYGLALLDFYQIWFEFIRRGVEIDSDVGVGSGNFFRTFGMIR